MSSRRTVHRGPDQRVDLVADVTSQRTARATLVAAQLGGRFLRRLEIHVAEHHPGALGDEALGDGKAQTLRSTRDDCGLTAQQRHTDHRPHCFAPPGTGVIQHHISYMILPIGHQGGRPPNRSTAELRSV